MKKTVMLDVIVGADHGQEKFRCLMKLLLRDVNNNIIKSVVLKIGHIDCPKDTYFVLKESIGPKLNSYLTSLISASQIIGRDNEGDVVVAPTFDPYVNNNMIRVRSFMC